MCIEDRLYEKCSIKDLNECWEWQAASCNNGYGRFKINGKLYGAHRVSFCLNNNYGIDELDSNDFICHKCDNPSCINPNHLFLGDRSDNMKDAWEKGRIPHLKDIQVKPGQVLSEPHNRGIDIKTARKIKQQIEEGLSVSVIAKNINVKTQLVSDIKRGHSYKNVKI